MLNKHFIIKKSAVMEKFFNQTYKNKKVLITGHTGFKGSWLSLWLTLLGAEVVGFSLSPNTEPNLFNVLNLEKHLTSIIGDIRNKEHLENVLNKHKPDFIFHLAAQPLVRRSYQEPHLTFETNIMGTVNLFEAVRKSSFEGVVVNITSDKCYNNQGNAYSFKENDPMGGYDPYSASKGAAELITSAYRNSFYADCKQRDAKRELSPKNGFAGLEDKTHSGLEDGLCPSEMPFKASNQANHYRHKVALASARAGNVIGGGDWADDRLIPDIVRALANNEEIIIRNPHAVRPWQHVMECISGYLLLGAKLYENPAAYCEGWNFGPNSNSTMTVEEILLKSLELWGSGNYKIIPENVLKEANFLKLDIGKAKEKLGWQPVYDINQSLKKTINWYKNYYLGDINMFDFTKNQIKEYCNRGTVILSGGEAVA